MRLWCQSTINYTRTSTSIQSSEQRQSLEWSKYTIEMEIQAVFESCIVYHSWINYPSIFPHSLRGWVREAQTSWSTHTSSSSLRIPRRSQRLGLSSVSSVFTGASSHCTSPGRRPVRSEIDARVTSLAPFDVKEQQLDLELLLSDWTPHAFTDPLIPHPQRRSATVSSEFSPTLSAHSSLHCVWLHNVHNATIKDKYKLFYRMIVMCGTQMGNRAIWQSEKWHRQA